MPRKLIYVPMIHTLKEFGGLEGAMLKDLREKYPGGLLDDHMEEIDEYWELVAERISESGLYQPDIAVQLHLFVDGLPNVDDMDGGAEELEKTVAKMIEREIPLYLIIDKLRKAGATLHGTESIALLRAERDYLSALTKCTKERDEGWEEQSVRERDQVMIARIDAVVPPEKTAIVFVGRKHNVVEPLTEPPYNFKFVDL